MPSVTQVLGKYADFSRVPPEALEFAAWRGSEVHQLCACYAQGLPVVRAIPPSAAGYFLSFQHWFDGCVQEVIAVEPAWQDPTYLFEGHPDLVLVIKGDPGPSIIDLKTPVTESPTWKGQLAAYDRLADVNGIQAHRIGTLRLDPRGGPAKLREYTKDGRDFAAFLAALTAHRFFTGG